MEYGENWWKILNNKHENFMANQFHLWFARYKMLNKAPHNSLKMLNCLATWSGPGVTCPDSFLVSDSISIPGLREAVHKQGSEVKGKWACKTKKFCVWKNTYFCRKKFNMFISNVFCKEYFPLEIVTYDMQTEVVIETGPRLQSINPDFFQIFLKFFYKPSFLP